MIVSVSCLIGCSKSNDIQPNNNTTQTSQTTRCQATTQKGEQCKRDAEKGSIYCWQHK